MSIITLDQLRNAATESKDYSDEIGAALYTLANTANTTATSANTLAETANTTATSAYAQANSAYSTANSAYALANTASNMTLYGSYDSTDESITFELG